MSKGSRYYRWRTAVRRHVWVIDRHWYSMLGWLYLQPERVHRASLAVAVERAAVDAGPGAQRFWRDWWRNWATVVFSNAHTEIDLPLDMEVAIEERSFNTSEYYELPNRIWTAIDCGEMNHANMLFRIKMAMDKYDARHQ